MKESKTNEDSFMVVLLGIVFDPQKRKILIGKREKKDPYIKELTWVFPGGKANYGEEIEEILKRKIKLKTGLNVENLGSIFSRTYKEDMQLLLIYHLCEVVSGEEKPGDDIIELKWVKPKELEKHFTTSFHPTLKEYILNLQ